jgi:pyruvate/2-oxoglutarate dehydrogenase complex dihydrolipoamide acyltransferase (E2) component
MTNIVVPELGESVVEARVARWLKKEGDRVEVGEPLVELETEKVDLEVNADKGGVLASITRREGEDVKIGELLGVVDETAAGAAAVSATARGAPPPKARRRLRRRRRRTRGQLQPHGEWRASTTLTSVRSRDQAHRDG